MRLCITAVIVPAGIDDLL